MLNNDMKTVIWPGQNLKKMIILWSECKHKYNCPVNVWGWQGESMGRQQLKRSLGLGKKAVETPPEKKEK
jgi:hypothetical protein